MKRFAETAAFATLAMLVHLILFAQTSDLGHEAGGAGGEALISLEAADATVAEMVEAWERPPQTPVPEPELNPLPAQDSHSVDLPRIEFAEGPRAEMRVAALPPVQSDTRPQLPPETARPLPVPSRSEPPPPPSEIALTASPRPQKRPNPPPAEAPETARKAEQNAPGRAAQRAAGTGGGSQAGQVARKATATASAGQEARAQAIWGAKIRSRIERAKRYPRGTQASGEVHLAITVSSRGRLLGVRIVRSSGNPVLDQAALDAVRRAGRFPAAPRELPRDSYVFSLAILLKR